MRGTDVPIKRKFAGAVNGGLVGAGSNAAAAASWPYVETAWLTLLVTAPCAAVH